MNIDEIFKIPAIPTGRNKRKMPSTPSLDFFDKFSEKKQHTEEKESEEQEESKEEYSAEIDQDQDDEEGGRFFGGGLTSEQTEILDFVDEYDDKQTEILTANNIKKLILKFEKAINKNQEMRVRYAEQPEKFMDSEADLDENIRNLMALTQAPEMYPELIKLGSIPSLLALIAHENTDISISTIDLVNELIDEDIGTSETELERSEQIQESIKTLVDSMLENELSQLLVQNLNRLDEKEEADRQGVFKTLSIFENIMSLDPKYAQDITLKTELFSWLLTRIQVKGFDANVGYASEILSISLQENRDIRLKLGELNGVDILLRALSAYRKKDASSEDESEFVENLFNCLCSLLNEPENKQRFFESEGIELMVIMLKEKTLSRIRAVKVLNYALSGEDGRERCLRFVDVSGLKYLFPLFMGKGSKKLKKLSSGFSESEDEEHITCILLSLLRNLNQGDVQRMRVILKFTEENFEKVDRLIEMKDQYTMKDNVVKGELEEARNVLKPDDFEEFQADFYLRRLDAGLFILQRVCLLIAILSEESSGVREKVVMLLKRNNQSMSCVFKLIEEETALVADFVHLKNMVKSNTSAKE